MLTLDIYIDSHLYMISEYVCCVAWAVPTRNGYLYVTSVVTGRDKTHPLHISEPRPRPVSEVSSTPPVTGVNNKKKKKI